MKRLAADMTRVEHFDLEGKPDVASRIIEIDEISRSFVRMKTGLRSFQKYVPADLVRNLVRLGEEAELGGERRELTIYFSDIAGFTSISEQMDPEELVRHLSVYFSDLGRIFLENRATIDKYIGDAIMAFWNAPERVGNHAELACRTALRVQARLAELNACWRAEGRPELGTRCGLATGEVIVGNMGSEDRLNYTVIGDTANLASRLEGLNKYYGTRIMIAEATRMKVEGLFRTRKLDIVAVSGTTRPIAIHELVAEAGPLPEKDEAFIAAYESALALHVERRWPEAIARLDDALRLRPEDLAAQNLRARCEDYRLAPPPDDWNGSHVMDSK
jgi:adenylate cyclase